jgi:hypothetical protein
MITWKDVKIAELRYQELGRLAQEIRLAQLATAHANQPYPALVYRLGGSLVRLGRRLQTWAKPEGLAPPTLTAFENGN